MTKFHVGKPAPPEDLVDRKTEIEYLKSRMMLTSLNYNVAVIGYRRIGKTSILLKIKDIFAKHKKFVVVYFDVKKNMGEPKIFLSRLSKTIFDAYLEKLSTTQKLNAKTSKFASTLIPRLVSAMTSKSIKSIGFDVTPAGTVSPKIDFEPKVLDYSSYFLSVLQTPTALASESKLKFVVILDEFQDLVALNRYPGLKNIFDLFRSVIQDRGNVSFVVSGSRVHMLEAILGKGGSSSLFVHFERLVVKEMDESDSKILFEKYLKARKMKPSGNTAKEAYELVGGQPFYLMAMAEAWKEGEDATQTFNRILTDPLGSLKLYAEYVLSEDLNAATGGPILRTILRALSDSDKGYSYSEISKKTSIPMDTLSRYMPSLEDADLIVQKQKLFRIRDRVVREYLRLEVMELS